MLAWFFPKVWKNVPNQQPIWTMSIIEGTKWCFFTATMKDYAWDGLRWPETAESQIRKLFYFEWSPPWQTMMRIIERHHWNKWSTCCDCCHASAVLHNESKQMVTNTNCQHQNHACLLHHWISSRSALLSLELACAVSHAFTKPWTIWPRFYPNCIFTSVLHTSTLH